MVELHTNLSSVSLMSADNGEHDGLSMVRVPLVSDAPQKIPTGKRSAFERKQKIEKSGIKSSAFSVRFEFNGSRI